VDSRWLRGVFLTRRYISDATNATLSGFVHPKTFKPIPLVQDLLGVKLPLPEVVDNYGEYGDIESLEFRVLIADQQAAAIAESATRRGIVKATLGTGLFIDMPTDSYEERRGLIPILLYKVNGNIRYGVEAYLPAAGRFIDLLISLGLTNYDELSNLSFEGDYIYIVPALAGLQYPPATWTRGALLGLKYFTKREELLSSVLATLAFYVKYVVDSSGYPAERVRVDGGGSRLGSFLRCLASIMEVPVEQPDNYEGTARGVLSLLAYDGDVELGKSLGKFTTIKGEFLYCKRYYKMWTRKTKFLKRLKPFFQVV
jgi:glycerol kinase